MEFWGIEVKGKVSTKVTVEDFHILHLSQAVLTEAKKDSEPVTLYVKVDDKKLVLGVLSAETNPQLSFDLVFEKDFELSHNAKNGCVHLLGYMSEIPDDEEFSGPSDEDEDVPNPEAVATIQAAIAKARAEKAAANPAKIAKANVQDDDDDSDDDEDSDDESDEDMDSDDDEDDDEESSEEEETPVKVESGKKRKAEVKTPESKKSKLATPQKTDGKKSAHTATPHPSKKTGKTPSGDKSTPKSGGQLSCGPCKKTFTSDSAFQSHTKAKHSGGK